MRKEYAVKGSTSHFQKRRDVIFQIKQGGEVLVSIKKEIANNINYFVDYEGASIGIIKTEDFKRFDFEQLDDILLKNTSSNIFVTSRIENGVIYIQQNASLNKKNGKDILAKYDKHIQYGIDVGMSKEDAKKRVLLLKTAYGLNDEQLELATACWKKPDREIKDFIPDISKIIYQDSVKKPLFRILGHIVKDGINAVRLVGTMSTGKGVLIESLASLLYIPLLEVDMQRNTEAEDFEGRETLSYQKIATGDYDEIVNQILNDEDSKNAIDNDCSISKTLAKCAALNMSKKKVVQTLEFIKEPLTIAMEKGCWINFDEINFAQAYILSRLHRVLDGRQSIHIPGYKTVYSKDGFVFFATMNPPKSGFAGTSTMNEALESRMMTICLEPTEHIDRILSIKYPESSVEEISILDTIYTQVRNAYEANDIGESYLSLRRYEAALTQQGFGTFRMSTEDHLLNISCNEENASQKMKEIIELSFD